MTSSFINLRQKLIDQNVLVQNRDSLEFPDDFIFSSPSTAAAIVMGRNTNGLLEWKLANGKTLKKFESSDKPIVT